MKTFKRYKTFIQEKTDSSLADGIKKVYLENLDSMSFIKQQHFLSRLSKCYTGKWKSKIKELGEKLANQLNELFTEYKGGEYANSVSTFIKFRNSNNAHLEAKQKGNKWVKDNQANTAEFLAYLEILMKFNIVHRLKCEQFIKDEEVIKNWLLKKWNKNVNWIIKNPDAFGLIPVQSVNVFYYMSSLKIMDPNLIDQKEEQFLNALKKAYEGNLVDDISFNNYLYALTHIIIGESWFYEYKLPDYRQKYGWIIDFFKENRERILSTATPDIIIEIGVVLLICNEIAESAKYKKYTRNKIGPNGYIEPLDKTKGPEESEHTNILAIMILKGF